MTSVEELGDFKAAVPGMVVNERTRTALAHKTLLAVPGAYTTTVRQLVGWETVGGLLSNLHFKAETLPSSSILGLGLRLVLETSETCAHSCGLSPPRNKRQNSNPLQLRGPQMFQIWWYLPV